MDTFLRSHSEYMGIRRYWEVNLVLIGVLSAIALNANAELPYPNKPIRMIVPWPAGGAADFLGRIIGRNLEKRIGQQIVIDNRPGGSTNIGSEMVARSTPDGYTLLMASSNNAVNMGLYGKLSYDAVRDFAPVTLVAQVPNILVANPAVRATNVKELIALAKSKPGDLTYASAGNGSPAHLAAELFKTMAQVDILNITYKGAAPAVIDVVGGQVNIMFTNIPTTLPHIKSGRLKALALAGSKRAPVLPDLPTIAESGLPGYEASAWYGVVAPAGTTQATIKRLHHEIVNVLKMPEVVERMNEQGTDPVGNAPVEFAALIKSDIAKYAKLIKSAGIKIE